MIIKVQITLMSDEGTTEIVEEVARLEREKFSAEGLGLNMAEAKTILSGLQRRMVEQQAANFITERERCPKCGKALRHNGRHEIVMRTVFGKLKLKSPRLYCCDCEGVGRQSFSPLAAALPERTTAEMLYLETKWASLVSYGMTLEMLEEVLPVGQDLNTTAIRQNVARLAERIESELGEEQDVFIEGCPLEWAELPRPEMPLAVGIDGGYVHAREPQKSGSGGGCFEIIVGKSIPTEGPAKCCGFVNRYDEKPKRRLFEMLNSQVLQMNQQITFLSDGGDTVRELQMYLSPQAEHLLDWFHVTMRLTVMGQMAKGLTAEAQIALAPAEGDEDDDEPLNAAEVEKSLESLKWNLWHGNVHRALQLVEDLDWDLELVAEGSEKARKLQKAVREFGGYITANREFIPNYGDRHRNGERISTGFVESAVNQVIAKRMVKKQQMRWTKRGAHLLLQIRTQVLNDDWGTTFSRWYPGMKLKSEAVAAA